MRKIEGEPETPIDGETRIVNKKIFFAKTLPNKKRQMETVAFESALVLQEYNKREKRWRDISWADYNDYDEQQTELFGENWMCGDDDGEGS